MIIVFAHIITIIDANFPLIVTKFAIFRFVFNNFINEPQ